MSLLIVAAETINQAVELLFTQSQQAVKSRMAEAPDGMDDFLYEFRGSFLNDGCYYEFDPYRETYLEKDRVPQIKIFSNSILKWIAERKVEENILIDKYGLTLKKVRDFAIKLDHVCDVAIKNGYGLVGIGD